MEFQAFNAAETGSETGESAEEFFYYPYNSVNVPTRRTSFVWKYFRHLKDTDSYECIICNGCVGKRTSNLARHLLTTHDILKPVEDVDGRGRQSRSFIWKYCTKEGVKHARCHLCQKLLYFGGGNTENIAKHLRRRHLSVLKDGEEPAQKTMDEETDNATASIYKDAGSNGELSNNSFSVYSSDQPRRVRKGASYVWNYCDKLSRHTIRCKLCSKVMSFHGTANVITHLQRRHNIVGPVDSDNASRVETDEKFSVERMDEQELPPPQRRSTGATPSVIWKYCTRISKEVARCEFCKKNLSYQGTSNLQRHLHRMHGISTPGRNFKEESVLNDSQLDPNLVWEHCSIIEGDQAKCNMCNEVFENRDAEEIGKHLVVAHAVQPAPTSHKRRRDASIEESSEDADMYESEGWNRLEDNAHSSLEANLKTDEAIYDDIIEEEHEINNIEEEPIYSSMLNDMPYANPLSPQSSQEGSPRKFQPFAYQNKQMQKLNEERIRMETEYFREKAGFYRMQKYLTALQAKKIRLELERLNGSVQVELNGEFTTVQEPMNSQ